MLQGRHWTVQGRHALLTKSLCTAETPCILSFPPQAPCVPSSHPSLFQGLPESPHARGPVSPPSPHLATCKGLCVHLLFSPSFLLLLFSGWEISHSGSRHCKLYWEDMQSWDGGGGHCAGFQNYHIRDTLNSIFVSKASQAQPTGLIGHSFIQWQFEMNHCYYPEDHSCSSYFEEAAATWP